MDITGATIVRVRFMTDAEIRAEGWENLLGMAEPVALELDNGMVLYPARDEEGNGPGELFGTHNGELVMIFPRKGD